MSANGRARAVLAAALEIEPESIGEDASIGTLEAWDSLAHLRLVQALERELGRELPAEHIFAIGSLADIAAVLGDEPRMRQTTAPRTANRDCSQMMRHGPARCRSESSTARRQQA